MIFGNVQENAFDFLCILYIDLTSFVLRLIYDNFLYLCPCTFSVKCWFGNGSGIDTDIFFLYSKRKVVRIAENRNGKALRACDFRVGNA